MRHVIDQAAAWQRSGTRFVVATVVRTWGSSPHGPGASMLVSEGGRVVGSVSGGCVEAEVCALAEDVLAGAAPVLARWGIGDEDAFAVGLTCGGTIEELIREMGAQVPLGRLAADVAAGVPVALVTPVDGGGCLVVGGGTVSGSLGDPRTDRAAALAAEGMLGRGADGLVTGGGDAADGLVTRGNEAADGLVDRGDDGADGMVTGGGDAADGLVSSGNDADGGAVCAPGRELLVQSFGSRPRLLIFGAAEFARPLADMGAALGYRVTVCDARPAFATAERFPRADEVVVERPDRWFRAHEDRIDATTAVCVLSHDMRFDVPVLTLALRSAAGYVGAMGSRRTHEDRMERLRTAGVTEAETARLRSPIGLDLGGRGPEEAALSILAEIVAVRQGGTALPLTVRTGPVHTG
ncbi:XdhC family protein [Streptomyces sp. P01-B04]|uniref:XdhC family protein n=1 Tax=Streptomyces poriferorum TaxID=2798799 RepID=UPI001C5F2290|nr:XdhC/CoxI family protein [Streptomyces poriferorum]MBW5249218.1 XdhC family protein [Streptomyces poriferorum]MBW5256725.1 XdhC family protein [Streptomyces poriferorum]